MMIIETLVAIMMMILIITIIIINNNSKPKLKTLSYHSRREAEPIGCGSN